MDRPSSIPVRSSGIPRPTSRLPVLKPSSSQLQLRSPASTDQLRKKPSGTSLYSASTTRNPPPSTTRRTIPSATQTRSSSDGASVFKKPIGRPPSRQTRNITRPVPTDRNTQNQEEDELGDLDGFRSASRASSRADSRAGFRDNENDYAVEGDTILAQDPAPRKSRPSLLDRTRESLSQLPSSPKGSARRRSSFFNPDDTIVPTSRPSSSLGTSRRPVSRDGPASRITPTTPSRMSTISKGSLTTPGKRSASAGVPNPSISTLNKLSTTPKPAIQARKLPLSQVPSVRNAQTEVGRRPLSNSKTMGARTPKSRPSLAGTFGVSSSSPSAVVTPTPAKRVNVPVENSPMSDRKISNSSAALREQIAKAKAARKNAVTDSADTPSKAASSSSALREQIAKAREAARRTNASQKSGVGLPTKEVPAITENEFGIVPDPAEMASFDFGLDDPFNQRPKGSKSILKRKINAARTDGRLNIAAMGLSEVPEEVLTMYKFDPNDTSIAWGEIVDLTTIIAADNEFEALPDKLFPDIDLEQAMESEDDEGPQFGGLTTLDLHGNILRTVPVGLRRLTQLTKLNLARNRLQNDMFEIICQIPALRELKCSENAFSGSLPSSLGNLKELEVLELQSNELTSLPEELGELVKLKTLDVSKNQLVALPTGLFTSVPIVELSASHNRLTGTFFNADTVPHLRTLQLSNNAITTLHEDGTIVLPSLQTIDISANRLSALPDMSTWTSLLTLMVKENKITTLPDGFFTLQHLRSVDLDGNDLSLLDERIALMEGLVHLSLAANPLRDRKFLTMNTEDIKRDLLSRMAPSSEEPSETVDGHSATAASAPESEWALTPSGTLDLSSKGLSKIEDDGLIAFAKTNDIRQLYLQQNLLTSITSAISQLTHLTLLDLSKNSIMQPFDEPVALPRLRELRLASNKLLSFDSLTTHLSAPALQQLDVTANRISGALPTLRQYFPELLFLLASDNAILDVSAESLDGLKAVNLSNNEIPRLDPRIGLLVGSLTSLEVEGNTFRVPNYMVLKKGTETVLAWLRDKIPADERNEVGEEEF